MTTDTNHLIMSNGSSALLFLDPETLEKKKYLIVKDVESEVGFLNELEFIKGQIFANVWQTNLIAIISPQNGKVTAWIDLTGLNPDPKTLVYPYVLNGIAYSEKEDLILVIGKHWPKLYGIRLIPLKNFLRRYRVMQRKKIMGRTPRRVDLDRVVCPPGEGSNRLEFEDLPDRSPRKG